MPDHVDSRAAPVLSSPQLAALLQAYGLPAGASLVTVGRGRIHGTFRLVTGAGDFLLQQINTHVFRDVQILGHNTRQVCERLAQAVDLAPPPANGRPRPRLTLRETADGEPLWRDATDRVWRLYAFIGDCAAPTVADARQTHDAARRFGEFLAAVSSLDETCLGETIPSFHDTPQRFALWEQAVARDAMGRRAGAQHLVDFAASRHDLAHALAPLLADGTLPLRVVHNDCKLDNVLFDAATGEALCVVDIDTVMPGGSALHDVGDLLRSAAALTGEEGEGGDPAVDPTRYEAVVRGYLAGAGELLSEEEIARIPLGARLITFELGLRFLTDHLQGDPYFGAVKPHDNLHRAERQFALLISLEAQDDALRRAVDRAAAHRAPP